MKFVCLFIFAVFAAPLSAVEFKVSDLHSERRGRAQLARRECGIMVAGITHSLIEEPEHDFHIGDLNSVSQLLVASGVPAEDAAAVGTLLERFSGSPFPNVFLRDTFAQVALPETADRLFVGVISPKHELTSGASAYFNAHFRNLETVNTGHLPNLPYVAGTAGLKRRINLVLSRFPIEEEAEQRAFIYFVNLMHEVRHFLDVDFISNWIVANRGLILMGKKPDAQFKRSIRITKFSDEEVIAMDTSFYTAFLESNGYTINQELYRMFYYPEDFALFEPQLREAAYDEIVQAGGVEYVRSNRITRGNVLQKGAKWREQMQKTIDRAQATVPASLLQPMHLRRAG